MSDNNTIDTSVTLSSPEDQLNKAFNSVLEDFEKTGTLTPFLAKPETDTEDSFVNNEDAGTNNETSDETKDGVTNNSQHDTTTTDTTETQPAGAQQTPDINSMVLPNGMTVQQLQNKLHEKENEVALWASRLNELSAQYRELKDSSKSHNNSVEDNTSSSGSTTQQPSRAIQDLYDIYPEVAEAVTEMMEAKTKDMRKAFEEAMNQRVIPIQQQLQQNAYEQNLNKILAAHPDTLQIVRSGALHTWADSLDPIRKAGAQHIMQYGTADTVIDLLTQYKNSLGTNVGSSSSSVNTSSNSNANTINADELAKKVLSMINTPSTSQEPTVIPAKQAPVYRTDEEAFNALAREYEASHKRF